MLDFWYIVTFIYRPDFGPIYINMGFPKAPMGLTIRQCAIAVRVLAGSVITMAQAMKNVTDAMAEISRVSVRWYYLTRSPHPILSMSMYYRAKQIGG